MSEKVPGPGDDSWLLSKAIIFNVVNFGMVFIACVTAVSLGGIVTITTLSKMSGFCTGLGIYIAVMAGREWLLMTLAPRFFNVEDVKRMSSQIDKK